ncbi:MAG: hypothetical protein ACI4SH_06620 [Candidatus Scatosoma sp.]
MKRRKAAREKQSGISAGTAACALVGAVAGAGFLSGRELLEFFGGFRILPLTLSGAGFFLGFLLFLRLGARFGGFNGAAETLFGKRVSRAVKAAALFASFTVGTAMLSAFHTEFPKGKPFLAAALVAAGALFSERGIKGLGAFSAAFTPFLSCSAGILIVSRGKFSAPESVSAARDIKNVALSAVYVCMNVLSASPVLCELGEKLQTDKKTTLAAALAALILTLLAAAILSVTGYDKTCYSHPMPLESVLRGGAFFSVISAVGMGTTFAVCFYPVFRAAKTKGTCAEIAVPFAFFLCSFVGFEKVVRFFYPAAGVLGGVVLVAAAVAAYRMRREDKYETSLRARKNSRSPLSPLSPIARPPLSRSSR